MSAALEAFLHQLVYMTNVYPSDSFSKAVFLGIVGYTNRHVGVVEYISQCVQVAVPVLLKGGEMVVSIIGETIERFVIRISGASEQPVRTLESRLRDLILSVHAQQRRKEKKDSFQVQLKPTAENCPDLVRGMSEGKWYQVQQPSPAEERRTRPIHDVRKDDFQISFFEEAFCS